ncbi:MAG: RNA polymerase subunit sigma, partial [Lachnospiraceae bacterium]|nr:RNA polymerase subunit sigma [Lachnospiraceae bacterium]
MEDNKIIQLYFNRSEQAIVETERKYKSMLFSISYRILKNKMDVEECLNDAYLTAWKTIPPQNPNPLTTYLIRIVRN